MSTTRLSFGAVLGTVQAAANTMTGALDAAAAGVGMLNSYVVQAAENQRLRQVADKEDFIENLVMEKAQLRAESYIKAENFCAKSKLHNDHYNASYETYSKLLRGTAE